MLNTDQTHSNDVNFKIIVITITIIIIIIAFSGFSLPLVLPSPKEMGLPWSTQLTLEDDC